jgi:hypothetical protein
VVAVGGAPGWWPRWSLLRRGAGTVGVKKAGEASVGAHGHVGVLKQWRPRAKTGTRRRRRLWHGGTAWLAPAARRSGGGGGGVRPGPVVATTV